MSYINYAGREINCMIVYVGPPMSGKSTNLTNLYNRIGSESKGKRISLATTDMDRTLYFDFLPLDLPEIRGFKVRVHL